MNKTIKLGLMPQLGGIVELTILDINTRWKILEAKASSK